MAENISRRNVIKAGVAAAAAGAATVFPKVASAASNKKIRWRMQTHWPTGVGYYKDVYVKFCDRVRAATGGELDITPLPPGAIVPTKDVFEAIGRGLFEISLIWPAYWIGKVPVAGHINGQLFTWERAAEMYAYFYDMGAIDIFRQAYGEHNVRFVAPLPMTGLALYSRRPIRTLDDFKGFKVRSTGIAAQVFQKAGATPVFFPGAEIYQALQTGVCDGAHWGTVSTAWDMKFQEVTDYIVLPYLAGINNGEIIMNQKKWDELPDDFKAIIEECAASTGIDFLRWSGYNDAIDIEKFQKEKMGELSYMDADTVAQMRKFSIEVVDEYSKKDPKYCAKAGELLKDQLKMNGRI
ncbi:TRAP transporter substrate-binding protein [uncultured Desulfosarcina sp.]|uniref:TRAP transporter substrate-binding protein n=1 Tax=uncultured Desulfosarcina sp. TaxID=218289 RepID=UPI0029C8B4C5|nr:TRAP transporter substrate-binding protein [uncultured Desulfosarcina sp.]